MSKNNGVFWGSKKPVDKPEEKVDNKEKATDLPVNVKENYTSKAYSYERNTVNKTYTIIVVYINSSHQSSVIDIIPTKYDSEFRIVSEINQLKLEDERVKRKKS